MNVQWFSVIWPNDKHEVHCELFRRLFQLYWLNTTADLMHYHNNLQVVIILLNISALNYTDYWSSKNGIHNLPVTVMKCGELWPIGSVSWGSPWCSPVAVLSLLDSAACSSAETSITGTPFTIVPAALA